MLIEQPRTARNPNAPILLKDTEWKPLTQLSSQLTPIERKIKVTNIFRRNKIADTPLVINRGGARSSKSYSLAQIFVERLVSCPGRRLLVLRKTLPSLRLSIFQTFEAVLESYGIKSRVALSKSHFNYTYGRSVLHFGSLDDPEKIKSSEWNDILLEEANEFTYDDYVTLKLRQSAPVPEDQPRNQMFMSFNPVDEFCFIKQRIMAPDSGEHYTEIHSTYKDNPFLSEAYVRQLEQLAQQDKNFYAIYTKGEWGKLDNVIFTNWSLVPTELYDQFDGETIYGLDFGFTNPSVLLEVKTDGFEVMCRVLLYRSGLTNNQLIDEMKNLIPEDRRGTCPIYADSAEPARIAEINMSDFWCMPSDKNIKSGIDFVRRFSIGVEANSTEMVNELRSYSWRTDQRGNLIDDPVRFNDHAVSALRYALWTHMKDRMECPSILIL